jgi:hypothetical protein
MGYTFMGFTSMGHTSIKLRNAKLLTRLTCVLKRITKYAQKQNLEVKIFELELNTVIK